MKETGLRASFFALASVFFVLAGSAMLQTNQGPQKSPLNPEFLKSLFSRSAQPFTGYLPSPVDLSHVDHILIERSQPPLALPAAWDSRTSDDIKAGHTQASCKTGAIFAAIGALGGRGSSAPFGADSCFVYLKTDSCHAGVWSLLVFDTLSKQAAGAGYRVIANSGSFLQEIKEAVFAGGTATLAYHHERIHVYPGSIYYYPGCAYEPNQLVEIVGWDDSIRWPDGSGSGAWVVQSSQGESGQFYLCYGSGNIKEVVAYPREGPRSNRVLFWDEGGWLSSAGYGDHDAWMASIFQSDTKSTITHVGFYATSPNARYSIEIRDGYWGKTLTRHSGECAEAGYYEIPLSHPVPVIPNQSFTVAVKMTTPLYNFPIPIEYVEPGIWEPPIQTGKSFVKNSAGDTWVDASSYGWNVCLRAELGISSEAGKGKVPQEEGQRIRGETITGEQTVRNQTASNERLRTLSPGICDAVDNCKLIFTTGGNQPWFEQAAYHYFGGRAVQSGPITHNQTSSLYTSVVGPGRLRFYWSVSSEATFDFLELYINGALSSSISGFSGWLNVQPYLINVGANTIEWRYAKDGSVSTGADTGWVDKVEFIPTAARLRMLVKGSGADEQIWMDSLNTSDISDYGWCLLTGGTAVAPSVRAFNNELHLFARGNTGVTSLYTARMSNTGSWSGWTAMDGYTPSSPGSTLYGDPNRLYLTVRGLDDAIYYRSMNTSSFWYPWVQVPGGRTSHSPAIEAFNNRLQLVVTGVDGSLWYNSTDASDVWVGWVQIGGASPSAPGLADFSSRLYLAVRGTDNVIYYKSMDNSGIWNNWSTLQGGSTSDAPALVVFNNRLYIVVKSVLGEALYLNSTLDGVNWSGWKLLDGSSSNSPSLELF